MRTRLIPVLLLDRDRRVVKTVRFGERTYIGDPFNTVRLFNEKEVDELVVLDIDASVDGRQPDVGFVAELASECFMPLSFGGGLNDVGRCEALSRAGAEKLVIGTAASDAGFLRALASGLGSQAIIGCVDCSGDADDAAMIRSGQRSSGQSAIARAQALADAGVGEILLQSIPHDGMRQGMNINLVRRISGQLPLPVIAAGGAGDINHLHQALQAGASAAASGSAFCFIGRLRAVLISYPEVHSFNGST